MGITLAILGGYLGVGLLFGTVFVYRGVQLVDPASEGTGILFRFLILPGVSIFWPLFAYRWRNGVASPPLENNAHRRLSGPPDTPAPSRGNAEDETPGQDSGATETKESRDPETTEEEDAGTRGKGKAPPDVPAPSGSKKKQGKGRRKKR